MGHRWVRAAFPRPLLVALLTALPTCTFLSGFEGLDKGAGGSGQGGQSGVGGGASVPIVEVATGRYGSCVIVPEGDVQKLFCWGLYPGVEGLAFSARPVEVALPASALSVVIGAFHRCAYVGDRSAEGENLTTEVLCWGENDRGQLGDGSRTASLTPVPTSGLGDVVFDRWSIGHSHACAFENGGGRGFCWGSNSRGQIGDGTTDDALVAYPLPVPGGGGTGGGGTGGAGTGGAGGGGPAAATWTGVSSQGSFHSCAIAEGDAGTELYCWGSNDTAQLGRDPAVLPEAHDPTLVTPPIDVEFDRVFSGGGHTCARGGSTAKPVYCWGKNDRGQLGTGDSSPFRATPLQVDIPTINSISIGLDHTCATFGDGPITARCWGANDLGQIGIAATDQSEVPADLTIKDPVDVLVALKSHHTCLLPQLSLDTPTELYCYGSNELGQLGNGKVGGFERERQLVRF